MGRHLCAEQHCLTVSCLHQWHIVADNWLLPPQFKILEDRLK